MTERCELPPPFQFPQIDRAPADACCNKIDRVCESIVRALFKQSRPVEGIEVSFITWGRAENRKAYVNVIEGKDFKLTFFHAVIHQIAIPKEHLTICNTSIKGHPHPFYQIEYSPYTGPNWEEDQEEFFDEHKDSSKVYKDSTFQNEGGMTKEDSKLTCQDSPESFSTREILNHFAEWLEQNVLKRLLQGEGISNSLDNL